LGAATGNQVQSIQVRKAEIDDESIVSTFQGGGFPRFRCAGRIHLVSGLYKGPFQKLLNGYIIFY
jgi:hypothetical protein